MLVSDIGEFELIDRLAAVISTENMRCTRSVGDYGFRMVRTIGDDAAAWDAPAGLRVLTTDTMVEGVHFNLSYTDWRDLGWKCLATNISDVAAMGCTPTYAIATLGLRGDLPVSGLETMYQGMMDIASECGGAIVGGDIVKSPVFFITIALEGASASASSAQTLLMRNTAMTGDLIAVTGQLGLSAGGLRLLMGDTDGSTVQSDVDALAHLKSAHNRPTPRVEAGVALAERGVRCGMDISDGLVDDLSKICRASRVGAKIHAERIPAHPHLKAVFPSDWMKLALGGGEDYELLLTAPPEVMHQAVRTITTPMSIIGEIVEGTPSVEVLDSQGMRVDVPSGGWDHFRRA